MIHRYFHGPQAGKPAIQQTGKSAVLGGQQRAPGEKGVHFGTTPNKGMPEPPQARLTGFFASFCSFCDHVQAMNSAVPAGLGGFLGTQSPR